MPPQNLNIKKFLDQAKDAREQYRRTGDLNALYRMITLYGEVNNVLLSELKQNAQQNNLQKQLESAGDNPPPGLLAKIQIATQAYQTWFTCLKSCADSKGEVQRDLARFR